MRPIQIEIQGEQVVAKITGWTAGWDDPKRGRRSGRPKGLRYTWLSRRAVALPSIIWLLRLSLSQHGVQAGRRQVDARLREGDAEATADLAADVPLSLRQRLDARPDGDLSVAEPVHPEHLEGLEDVPAQRRVFLS